MNVLLLSQGTHQEGCTFTALKEVERELRGGHNYFTCRDSSDQRML